MIYEGFTIGGKHTYRDWGLRCYDYKITFPESQKSLIQIPGRNGKIDVALPQQREAYGHRTISIYCDAPDRNYKEWVQIISDIANHVQDEYLPVIPDFDENYYYRGWIKLEVSKDFKEGSDIVFSIDAEPYKLRSEVTIVEADVDGETTVVLNNDKLKVNPKLTTDADIKIVIGGNNETEYKKGVYAKAGFILPSGSTTLTLNGAAHVKFEYQEGRL